MANFFVFWTSFFVSYNKLDSIEHIKNMDYEIVSKVSQQFFSKLYFLKGDDLAEIEYDMLESIKSFEFAEIVNSSFI